MRLRKKILYLLPSLISFYVIPLILFLLSPVLIYGVIFFYLILWYVINPIVCFVPPLIFGAKNRFKPSHLLFSLLIGVLYLFSLLIFFGVDIIYGDFDSFLFAYMFITLLGYVIGAVYNIYKRAESR